MTAKYANWREWLEALRAQPWLAESDHAAEVLQLLNSLEHIAESYGELFNVLERAGHRDASNDGFDIVARVGTIAYRDEALYALAEQAGLIDGGNTTTDLIPLLRMFLPVEPSVVGLPRCSLCSLPQRDTPSGLVCANGHGGAPSLDE